MKPDRKQSGLRRATKATGIGSGVALLWITLVLGLYYWGHKPLTPALARAMSGAAVDVIAVLVMVLVGGAVGRWALLSVDTARWTLIERVGAAALIGLCITALAIYGVGLVSLSGLSMLGLGAGLGVLARRTLLGWTRDLISLLRSPLPPEPWDRAVAGIVISMIVITAVLALLPPQKWDVLTYHLAGPEQYVTQGRFYAVPHNHFLGFPQLVEALFSAQLTLTGRLTGGGVLHWVIGILVLGVTGGYVARYAGAGAGWFAAAVLLAGKSFWLEMTFAYVDLLPIGLAVVALGLADLWNEPMRREDVDSPVQNDTGRLPPHSNLRIVTWLGVLAGFGLGVKYSVLWLVVSLGALVIWLGRHERWRTRLIQLALFGLCTLLVFAPWLIRNMSWYRNPLYPFVLETAEMDSIRHEWYSQPRSGLAYSDDAWQVPVLPLAATVLGVEGKGTYGTDIGPFYLMLVPLTVLVSKSVSAQQRRAIARAILLATVTLVLWVISSAFGSYISLQTRLIFYVFGPLAIVSAMTQAGLRWRPKKPFDLHFVVRAIVIVALSLTLLDAIRFLNNSGANRYFSGEDDFEDDYLEHALGWHYVTMQRVNTLPPGSVVRFLWEPRYLYCDECRINCYTDSLMDSWYYARRTIDEGAPEAVADTWQNQGTDYLLVYEFGRKFEQQNATLYDETDWNAWDEFEQQFLAEVWRTGSVLDEPQYILYRWRP